MQVYCENCHLVFDGERCPVCKEKQARTPRPDDACFLCEKEYVWAEMLEDVLKSKGIPVMVKKRLGIGMALKTGLMLESVKIYVPFSSLREAEQIVRDLFSEKNVEQP